MMVTKLVRGMFKSIIPFIVWQLDLISLKISIIQDCEDALTNWVEAKAAVRSRLSIRGSRQRRTHGRGTRVGNGEGISLADQDRPLLRGSGEWVPADEHGRHRARREEDDEYEDITDGEEERIRHLDGEGIRTPRRERDGPITIGGISDGLRGRDDERSRGISD